MKGVMVNLSRCIGCRHCEIACAVAHSQTKNLLTMIRETPVSFPRIFVETGINFLTFPNRCRHCEPAPCMQVCPTHALYRDEKTGSVVVNYERCINCTACSIACPFGIIQFKQVHGVSRTVNAKCDNCIERQKNGEIPACVEACKTGALEFGDINELIRTSRKDFTVRIIKSQGAEVEVPKIPENITAWRSILEKIAHEGTFKL
ncbi:4Fe-4S dicluster domain-containing protein [Thermodesulfovibrio yellowstonii]|uniref:Formate dehydrogenase n=1 Tax=Thermodesulfovibrio yellowstonii TaxID=28262 RepID=A0A9W6GH49_9BACT|nr:4Fe-4S dicluster domain-containing protein [Thermodesulfovibrio islandicus]GLI53887.1 formate dehydrogenase [Thermodesulfovibrio islandicus]